jgi:hypothetical protein
MKIPAVLQKLNRYRHHDYGFNYFLVNSNRFLWKYPYRNNPFNGFQLVDQTI